MIGLGTQRSARHARNPYLPILWTLPPVANLVDGNDIRSFPVEESAPTCMRHAGAVLGHGKLTENIAYGRPTATHAEIVADGSRMPARTNLFETA